MSTMYALVFLALVACACAVPVEDKSVVKEGDENKDNWLVLNNQPKPNLAAAGPGVLDHKKSVPLPPFPVGDNKSSCSGNDNNRCNQACQYYGYAGGSCVYVDGDWIHCQCHN